MTNEPMTANDREALLQRLYVELETTWNRERDPAVADRLASRYPDYVDALYDFFDLVLSSEEGGSAPDAARRHVASRLREWLHHEGFSRARAEGAARRGRVQSAASPPVSGPAPVDTSHTDHTASPAGRTSGGGPSGPPPLVGVLRTRTRLRLDDIATSMDVPKGMLTLMSHHPALVPGPVREEVAARAEARLGVNRAEVVAALTRTTAYAAEYAVAASRNGAYGKAPETFADVLESAGLSATQRDYWAGLAGPQSGTP